jgi:dolichol-phosphate mannosyltransferase
MKERPLLSVVAPVYNEEEIVLRFLQEVRAALSQVTEDYEIILSVDPCTDRTVEILREEHARDPRVKVLLLSRRFGQHAATIGGLSYSRGQAVIVIDSDLQDPPSLIGEMVQRWREGYKVVIPQRRSRRGENLPKRAIAYVYSKVINRFSRLPIPRNIGDFRLMDRVVVGQLLKLKECHGFLRGLASVVGFKTYLLPFDRDPRAGGQNKYSRFTGSLRIGLRSLVAFSDALLNFIAYLGLSMAVLAIVAAVVVVYLKARGLYDFAAGLATVTILLLFLSGVQLTCMGILGMYIGQIYEETKNRPIFIVDEAIGFSEKSPGADLSG